MTDITNAPMDALVKEHPDSLFFRVEPLLSQVERPSRYINHEFQWLDEAYNLDAATKMNVGVDALIQPLSLSADTNVNVGADVQTRSPDSENLQTRSPDSENHQAGNYRAVFIYPDTYEIGQANQAIAILHNIANIMHGVIAERAFLPWLDMIALMRKDGIPLFTLENCLPVATCDLIGITMPHELALTNILECLDLAGLPILATERARLAAANEQAAAAAATTATATANAQTAVAVSEPESLAVISNENSRQRMPLVIGGGPLSCNPEPMAAFFDAIAIGEGEELISEIINLHRDLLGKGCSHEQILQQLAGISGVYVPSLGRHQVTKRIVADLDAWPVITNPLVPYAEVSHDRLNVEILRGCARGCRFCQAGIAYRPVRERHADTIITAVSKGLSCSGYDEVSLTSLSSCDHSHIEEILRRLGHLLDGRGISISLPSQRLDAFGVAMAHLVDASARRTGLTFAPEAGTQRLRDVINKNVTEADLLNAIHAAYTAGWRRCKLYFMIGLPAETDDDILGIVELVNRAYLCAKDSVPASQRGNVRLSLSVAVFVPKAQTPFQWDGQISPDEASRKISLLRNSGLHKGIDLHWHDPISSLIEAAFSRAGREAAQLVEAAWRMGARFDAWSEQFSFAVWQQAAAAVGMNIYDMAAKIYTAEDELPWDHLSFAVDKDFLLSELEAARNAQTTSDCTFSDCSNCGVCVNLTSKNRVFARRQHNG